MGNDEKFFQMMKVGLGIYSRYGFLKAYIQVNNNKNAGVKDGLH